MIRPVWSGAIQIALITVAVKLYKANKDGKVHFNNVHAICHSPLKQKKWCPVCKVEIIDGDINKAFALSKDNLIEFSEAELEAITVQGNKQIVIEKSVDLAEIPPSAFDTMYYLQPEQFSEHVYTLLTHVLMTKKQALVGKFVMRSKEHIAAIQYHEGGLLLTTLHWNNDINQISPLLPAAEILQDAEIQLASTLIDNFHGPLKLDTLKDTYREKVLLMIEKRAKGEVITAPEVKVIAEPPRDIMADLKRSIEIKAAVPTPQVTTA